MSFRSWMFADRQDLPAASPLPPHCLLKALHSSLWDLIPGGNYSEATRYPDSGTLEAIRGGAGYNISCYLNHLPCTCLLLSPLLSGHTSGLSPSSIHNWVSQRDCPWTLEDGTPNMTFNGNDCSVHEFLVLMHILIHTCNLPFQRTYAGLSVFWDPTSHACLSCVYPPV